MKNERNPRRRRGHIKVAALLASLSLAAGAQALAPTSAWAETSTGDNCSEAIIPIDCFVDEDDTGVTGGTGDAGAADPSAGPVSGIDDGESDSSGTWGQDDGSVPGGGIEIEVEVEVEVEPDPEIPIFDPGDPDPGMPVIEQGPVKPKRPAECDQYLKDVIGAKQDADEKAAMREFIACLRTHPGPTTIARGDAPAHKLSARQRKLARSPKKVRPVARAARSSRLRG
jgi:hypothetical protein